MANIINSIKPQGTTSDTYLLRSAFPFRGVTAGTAAAVTVTIKDSTGVTIPIPSLIEGLTLVLTLTTVPSAGATLSVNGLTPKPIKFRGSNTSAFVAGSSYIFMYDGTNFLAMDSCGLTNYLPLAGGTMAGNITLTNNSGIKLVTSTNGWDPGDRSIPFSLSNDPSVIRWYSTNTNTGLTYSPNTGAIKAGSFVKRGGTSSQFLKADGSVDSNTYLTTANINNILYFKEHTDSSDNEISKFYATGGKPTYFDIRAGKYTTIDTGGTYEGNDGYYVSYQINVDTESLKTPCPNAMIISCNNTQIEYDGTKATHCRIIGDGSTANVDVKIIEDNAMIISTKTLAVPNDLILKAGNAGSIIGSNMGFNGATEKTLTISASDGVKATETHSMNDSTDIIAKQINFSLTEINPSTILGNKTSSKAIPKALSVQEVKSMIGLSSYATTTDLNNKWDLNMTNPEADTVVVPLSSDVGIFHYMIKDLGYDLKASRNIFVDLSKFNDTTQTITDVFAGYEELPLFTRYHIFFGNTTKDIKINFKAPIETNLPSRTMALTGRYTSAKCEFMRVLDKWTYADWEARILNVDFNIDTGTLDDKSNELLGSYIDKNGIPYTKTATGKYVNIGTLLASLANK